ncbi:hypothetical protein [Desulfofundulus thermosubterraneus]|uniref:Uncharacterized protein n=1 Tax=Desulfofundulus thermosubterraneus DSM 16057 TaxID=1121432 RepID=A0A1M6KM00_9FIRM|nr:hypothetical protein [Desulfofundulus thermosubterraneus]SHJ59960.1 hypothetical protein SAMN02745219_02918 [Desulfofundulus thermosubterraneus DSM 16057]
MLDLPSELYRPVATLLYTLLCVAMGIIAYFLRDIRQSVKEKQQEQDQKIDGIQKDLNVIRETLPQRYVLRDDFIRAIAGLDNKVDNIGKEVSEINKALNRLIGGVR